MIHCKTQPTNQPTNYIKYFSCLIKSLKHSWSQLISLQCVHLIFCLFPIQMQLYHSHIQHIFHSPDDDDKELTEEEQNLKATLASKKKGLVTGTPTKRNNSRKADPKASKQLQKKPVKCVTPNPPAAEPVNSRSFSEPSIMMSTSSVSFFFLF